MMGLEADQIKDKIARSLDATDEAVDVIREGEYIRRQIALELRDLQLTMNEDFETMKDSMNKFEKNIYDERQQSGKWMNAILHEAKSEADRAVKSRVLLRDVQLLEKKVDILQDSVINVNHSYAQYDDQVDIGDLKQQIVEMVYRTEKKEKELLDQYKGNNFEEKVETILRNAIESLLGLQVSNPKILAEARELAGELRGFRDAAANKNLFTLIGKQAGEIEDYNLSSVTSDASISELSLLNTSEKFENRDSARKIGKKTTMTPVSTTFSSSKSGKSSASPFIDLNASSTPSASTYSSSASSASSSSSGTCSARSKTSKSSSHMTI